MARGTAIVTGGSGTLGLAIGRALRADGWPVLLVDLSEGVTKAAAGIGAQGVQADLTDPAARADLVDKAGCIGALVNCAGIGRVVPFFDTDEALWDAMLHVNLTVPMRLSQAVARVMADQSGGVIVNIASVSGQQASRGRVAYGTSKAGLIHLTKQMAVELAEHGIRCNAVAPGPVEGPLAKHHPPEQRQRYLETIPQGRYAEAPEIAEAVRFLVSDGASNITGHCLNVDGGWQVAGV
ncbi:SDR family oxidoreductase [Antarctobacter sp.]|uniref:SDR family NAD(P)-dependent oxidoreductase n=1 Tax=Antarctobacter sp. TaxID=1872577 RepID=UPI002B26EA41|nr:SDR family oxidoreductase [Antarctobacter sp.]